MGRLSETCGAVTGAYLVIGLKCGQTEPSDLEARERTYALVREFDRRFRELNSTTVCGELLGAKLLSDDGAKAQARVAAVCPKAVRDAARILESVLQFDPAVEGPATNRSRCIKID